MSLGYLQLFPDSIVTRDEESNIGKLWQALGQQSDELESVLVALLCLKNINEQSGNILDLIGDIVREKRNGLGDSAYRLYLMIAIKKMLCSGSIQDINEVMKLILDDYYIATVDLTPDQESVIYKENRVYLSGDLYLDGTVYFSGLFPDGDPRAEMNDYIKYLDGSHYLNGGFYLSGKVFQPGFFEIRIKSNTTETIKANLSQIINYIKPAGVKFRLLEMEV